MNLQHRLMALKSFITKSEIVHPGIYIAELSPSFFSFLSFSFLTAYRSIKSHSKTSSERLESDLDLDSQSRFLALRKAFAYLRTVISSILLIYHKPISLLAFSITCKSTPSKPFLSKKWIQLGFHLFHLPFIQRQVQLVLKLSDR